MTFKSLVAVAFCCALAGCGSGGGSGPVGGDEIDRSGLTVGTITQFGSVYVNGIRFETGSAAITNDGVQIAESDLAVGQVAVITGPVNGSAGTAQRIAVDALLTGPIGGIDTTAATIVVLGTTVRYDGKTVFASPLTQLQAGDVVAVFGFHEAAGTVLATRIESSTASAVEVTGIVENLDGAALTFTIGSLDVDYAQAVFEEFGGAAFANGQLVEVEGDVVDGILVAEVLELEQIAAGADGDDVEIEGIITAYASNADFSIATFQITTHTGTQFFNGTSAELAVGVRIEVEGTFNAAGVVVADEIEFEEDAEASISTTVDAVGTASVTLVGALIETNAQTIFIDDSLEVRNFSLVDLNPGDWVRVNVTSSAPYVAAQLKREDPEDETEVEGLVTATDPALATLEVLTIAVLTDAQTEYPDSGDQTLAEFIATLDVGDEVRVRGVNNGDGTMTAADIED